MVRYHWGSIGGGSFMLGFFYFVDLLFNFIDVIIYLLSPKKIRNTQIKKEQILITIEKWITNQDLQTILSAFLT